MTRNLTFVALLCAASAKCASMPLEPVDYVNTLMGTFSTRELSTGNTYPAVAMPWGMNFWTPQTGTMGDGWAYQYQAEKIRGFKQTHQPSPWMNDYGQFALMPVTGGAVFDQEARASWFSHKAEEARPYYYRVYLADHDVVAEITPTERAAIMRFTFPPTDSAMVVVDAFDNGSSVSIDTEKRRITGYTTKNSGGVPDNFRNYFVVEFDQPFTYEAVVEEGEINAASPTYTGNHAGGIVGWNTARGQQITACVASSFISPEQALRNLEEVRGKQFEDVKQAGRDRWNQTLGRVEVSSDNLDQLRTFYSCLYRAVLFPRGFYEMDAQGQPVHYSPYDGKVHKGYLFTDTGFWDTFRSLFPLVNLLYPSQAQKMQQGWVNAYRESGFLPEWSSPGHRDCMVGNNSASVVADAYIKGIRGYDIHTLWKAVTHGAHSYLPGTASGRRGYEYYDSLGYVPCDVGIKESAARTLEYAYDDWCILQLGQALGRTPQELAPYAKAALNYRNLYDPESHLMRGKNADGTFQSPFNPLKWGDAFTEGNAWHYSWSVFHDPQGLIDLMGGEERFTAMLDSVFAIPPLFDDSYYGGVIHEIREMQIMNMGNYAHGNQPIQHMIYLYCYAGQPWKAQKHLRDVMERMYTPNCDGYCGDEDNGQTSAWYLFSAMGFYPVCPATNQYVIGSPLFPQVKLHLENGNTLTLEAAGNTADTPYIQGITIDGHDYPKSFFTHSQLASGSTIRYQMSPTPNLHRATTSDTFPYSFSHP